MALSEADARHPHHRRRPGRLGSRLAAREQGFPGPPLRNARQRHHDPGASDRRARGAGLLEQLPFGRCAEQRRRPAPPGDARPGLADHGRGRPAQGARRLGPGGGSRRLLRGGDRGAGGPSEHRDRPRACGRAARGRAADRRHRPPHRTGSGREHRHRDRQGPARILRRDRADRASREHRHGSRLVPVALEQGGTRRHGQGLYQLPDDQGAVSRLPRGLARGREDRVPRMGECPLFRRLHAGRGDGRAGSRYPALRADEGRRARRSQNRALALCGGPAAAGQRLRHAMEHGRLPDQA